MEEYVKEAPQTGSTWERQDIKEKDESSHKEETPEAAVGKPAKQETEAENEQQEPELLIECESLPMICTDDFLGFNDFDPKAAETEESSLPTIAISSNGTDPPLPNTGLGYLGGTGWGMALFSAPTNDTTPAPDGSVGVGIDKQLHSNLYEEDTTRRQTQCRIRYGYRGAMAMQNPFDPQRLPFAFSNNIGPSINGQQQMGMLPQQQQIFQQQEAFQKQQMFQQPQFQISPPQQPQNMNMNMIYYRRPSQYPRQQMLGVNPSNAFADPFPNFSSNTTNATRPAS